MNIILSNYWLLVAAAWMFVTGVLHDIAVLMRHKGPYSRDLLRLLMDGHVLMLSGVVLAVCYFMIQQRISYGAIISIITAIFMLVYCAMIFPFLKSFATPFISIMVLAVGIKSLIAFSQVNSVIQNQ